MPRLAGLCCILLLLSGIFIFYGPTFLVVSEAPVAADVVVVFVGPGGRERQAAAARLVSQGWAPLMLVPARDEVFLPDARGGLAQQRRVAAHDLFRCGSGAGRLASMIMENTHWELLMARCAMDRLHARSAILVSSPYHMRRIRLIAGRVFDKTQYRVTCVVATGELQSRPWRPEGRDWWWLLLEYPKILWFVLYEPFL